MALHNIIFDLDGTLIDSARITGLILDQMLAERGVDQPADREAVKRMDAVGGVAMIAAVLGVHTTDPAADLEEFRHRHRLVEVPQDVPFPGVAAALRQLGEHGIGMAICSNKPQFLCDRILGELGLAGHFTAIIGSAPDRARKPHPQTAHLALQSLGGTPEDTLYCGDSVVDLATARAAGLHAVLAAWGYGTEEALALEPQTPVLPSLSALQDAALEHGSLALGSR